MVQVRLAPGRARPRLRADAEHGPELPLWLQLVRARHGFQSREPRLRSDEPRLPRVVQRVDPRRHPQVSTIRHHRLPGHGRQRGRAAERDAVVHRHAEQVGGRPFAANRDGVPPVSRDRLLLRQQPDRPVQLRFDVDARTARQLDARARQPRSVVRLVPARPAELGLGQPRRRATTRNHRCGASTCRTTGASIPA